MGCATRVVGGLVAEELLRLVMLKLENSTEAEYKNMMQKGVETWCRWSCARMSVRYEVGYKWEAP